MDLNWDLNWDLKRDQNKQDNMEDGMKNNRIYDTLMELCKIESISETAGENQLVDYLYGKISAFNSVAGTLTTEIVPILKDKFKRNFFYSLYENENSAGKTVILLSHHDVVSAGDYGNFRDLAFLPEEYTEFLKGDKGPRLDDEAAKDLQTGDWIFGKGTMDMKFGLAMSVETLRKAAENGGFSCNILLLSVPDEEANSAGMLGSVETLLKLKKEKKLEFCGAIIPEPFFNKEVNDMNKYIYSGAIGKLLPVVLAIGKEAHSGEPLSGLSAASLISEFTKNIELNPILMDSREDFYTPPPVCLKIGDLREGYSVSLIGAAYAYFNIMTVDKTPDQVMDLLKEFGVDAFEEVLSQRNERIREMNLRFGKSITGTEFTPKIRSFLELSEECKISLGKEFELRMDKIAEENSQMDSRDLTIKMMMEAVKLLPDKSPMLLLAYGPPFYPHSSKSAELNPAVRVVEEIQKFAIGKFGVELKHEEFFSGLSDMSYLSLPGDFSVENLSGNFPMWGRGYSIPLDTIKELDIPFICLGPWGKDAHKYTERLNLSYSFQTVPKLFHEAIKSFSK